MTAVEGREMSGMWNRTLVYLGLREEPEGSYDELPERFVPEDDPHAEHAPPRRGAPAPQGSHRSERHDEQGTAPYGSGLTAQPADDSNVRPLRTGDVHVRAVPPSTSARVAVVEVAAFDDVEAIGARYRTGQPVLFDVTPAGRDVGRRVVDFVSGLTFALRGRLTKVGSRAFLLVPDGVELAADEKRRLEDMGYRLADRTDT